MKTFRQIKKIAIAAIGFIVLISGIILIVLPGPASLVIPAGLAILATEFVWARNLLDKIKSKIGRPRQGVDIN
ncbi:MAG: PGPGW domain-containing protein [Ignavibacteriaceae bacterium]